MKIKNFEKFSYDGELFYYFDDENNENDWSTDLNLLQSYIIDLQDRINETTKDYCTRAFNQLVKASKTLKAMGENDNIRLEIKDGEFVVAQF